MLTRKNGMGRAKVITVCNLVICGLSVLMFAMFILPGTRPFPNSDDWGYVYVLRKPTGELLRWIVTPHNEHFMPVVKAAQYAILYQSGFDFRSLIALNCAFALIGAISFFYVAQRFRCGSLYLGDLFISLIVFNMAFNVFFWGFMAPFAVSVSSSAAFLALFGLATKHRHLPALFAAYAVLTVCALTAMSGLVITAVISLILLCATFATKWTPFTRLVRWLSGVELLICSIVALQLGASGAPISIPDVAQVGSWIYNLSKSSFALTASTGGWWKSAFVLALAAAACALAVRHVRRTAGHNLELFDIAVYASLGGYLALAATIVVGRAAIFPWRGLEFHYGYLVTPVTIFSWIIVSRFAPKWAVMLIGGALLVSYSHSFAVGLDWRRNFVHNNSHRYQDISYLIRSKSVPPADIISKYMSDFYWIDSADNRKILEYPISILRESQGTIWAFSPEEL
jgi:hypothetical protein